MSKYLSEEMMEYFLDEVFYHEQTIRQRYNILDKKYGLNRD